MDDEQISDQEKQRTPRGVFNGATAVLVFLFVWLVFDNLALGIVFGLIAGGGSELAQRAGSKKND